MADFYETLGVSRKASQQELRSAYRKLARKYHPDVSQSVEANQTFARISEAYRVLSNPESRQLYDLGGSDFLSARKHTQDIRVRRAVYQANIDRVVDAMLEEEREEATARGHAVIVVVTLFISTFIVAVFKPAILMLLGLFWKILAVMLFILGIRFLFESLYKIFEKYTYTPTTPSVTQLSEPPKQPFSRRTALAFLVIGYFFFLTAGSFMGYQAAKGGEDPYFDNAYLINILLLPPISVFIVCLWRFLFEKMDKILDI